MITKIKKSLKDKEKIMRNYNKKDDSGSVLIGAGAGALIGGIIGSVVPGVGTAIGTAIGSAIGGATGAAIK